MQSDTNLSDLLIICTTGMKKKLNQLVQSLNKERVLFLGISFGIFLFVLFFQPFPLDQFDFNYKLLFVAGFGAIVFIFIFLVRILFPWLYSNYNQNYRELFGYSYAGGFTILVLSTVAFSFYLQYVGLVKLSIYIVFKVVLICLAPPVILAVSDRIRELMEQNENLISEKKIFQKKIEKYEDENLNKTIEIMSENNTENLKLLIADVVLIKSADNYVEIFFMEGDQMKKKLIRNTLKSIELQIKPYSNFLRCHRVCIINVHYIEKLISNYGSYSLKLKYSEEKIPVSRQYLIKVKESI